MERKCPVCHKAIKGSVQKQNEEVKFFPFCSERCKLVDLAWWLDGRYKIISEFQSQESDKPPDDSSGTNSRKQ